MSNIDVGSLNRAIGDVHRGLNVVIENTNILGRQVDQVQQQQGALDDRVAQLRKAFDEFILADRLQKELHLAETRVVRVRQELEHTFGHHADVRHRATGILQAVDTGLVTHETIQGTTEDVMMRTPRYWLAPALVALAAWIRDDRALAQKALEECARRDMDKTALFFGLVLRRYGRTAVSAAWLRLFLSRQDPHTLPREFMVLMNAVVCGAFGPEGRKALTAASAAWLTDLERETGFVDGQVARWSSSLSALTPGTAPGSYPILVAVSPTWNEIEKSLRLACLHGVVRTHFETIMLGELTLTRSQVEQIDDMLKGLVSEFDTEELPLRLDEARLQAIIDHNGDVAAAQSVIDDVAHAFEARVDFPQLLTNAAMYADESGADTAVQRYAIAVSKDWIIASYDQLVAEGRNATPASIDLSLEGWAGRVEEGVDAAALATGLASHVDAQTDQAVGAVKFGGWGLGAAIGAVGSLILVLASPILLVVPVGLAIAAFVSYQGLDGKRQSIRQAGESRKAVALEQLNGALAECVDFAHAWQVLDAEAEATREMLSEISTSSLVEHRENRGVLV